MLRSSGNEFALNTLVPGNVLLDGLSREVMAKALSHLELRTLTAGETLYSGLAIDKIRSVYFPISAVISMTTVLSDGDSVEALPVGHEGLAGFQVIFGSARMLEQWVCAIPGAVLEMRVEDFWQLLNSSAELGRILLCYSQSLITALAVSVACNARHTVLERSAKWLLLANDRVPSGQFPMTHELLASLLGVRRAGISVIAADLQRSGSIAYMRGRIEVLDRSALERISCECYESIRTEYDRLMAHTDFAAPVRVVDIR